MVIASIFWMLELWISFVLAMSFRFFGLLLVGVGFEQGLAIDLLGCLGLLSFQESLIQLMPVVLLTSHVVGWVRRVSETRGSRMWRFRRYFLQRIFCCNAILDQRLLYLATAFSGVGDISLAQKGILD